MRYTLLINRLNRVHRLRNLAIENRFLEKKKQADYIISQLTIKLNLLMQLNNN